MGLECHMPITLGFAKIPSRIYHTGKCLTLTHHPQSCVTTHDSNQPGLINSSLFRVCVSLALGQIKDFHICLLTFCIFYLCWLAIS